MAFVAAALPFVAKLLPKVIPVVSNLLSTPVGKAGLDILKQLASSVFAKDGQQGVFSDKVQISLPNPLSRLNKLLGNLGKTIGSVSDFLKNISTFLSGERKLETGGKVNVPTLQDRAPTAAATAGSTAQQIANGGYSEAIASSAAASVAAGGTGGSIIGGIKPEAFSTALTPDQQNLLGNVKDPAQKAQMTAQFQMQNYQNLMQFISNIMRIMGDISRSVIQNIR